MENTFLKNSRVHWACLAICATLFGGCSARKFSVVAYEDRDGAVFYKSGQVVAPYYDGGFHDAEKRTSYSSLPWPVPDGMMTPLDAYRKIRQIDAKISQHVGIDRHFERYPFSVGDLYYYKGYYFPIESGKLVMVPNTDHVWVINAKNGEVFMMDKRWWEDRSWDPHQLWGTGHGGEEILFKVASPEVEKIIPDALFGSISFGIEPSEEFSLVWLKRQPNGLIRYSTRPGERPWDLIEREIPMKPVLVYFRDEDPKFVRGEEFKRKLRWYRPDGKEKHPLAEGRVVQEGDRLVEKPSTPAR